MVLRYDGPPDSSCPTITVNRFLRDKLVIKWLFHNYAFSGAPGDPSLEAINGNGLSGQREPRPLRSMLRGSPPVLGDQFCAV